MKKIDRYIIGKFLGTFFFSITLILMIVVVFDISERMEDFLDKKPPLNEIVFDYYMNFVPYFGNLFSPLFIFIAVIFFTSRMAYNSEIVAILSSGVSFRRILFPYLLSASVLAGLSLFLNHFVIPKANRVRLDFEELYLKNPFENKDRNIHRQVAPGTFVYFSSFNALDNTGYQFSLEKIKDRQRYWHLRSDHAKWDSVAAQWTIVNYFIREIKGEKEIIRKGAKLDTAMGFFPAEFKRRINKVETMPTPELKQFIAAEIEKGAQNTAFYEVELERRTAFPFAAFVLTIIGAALASKRVRGGTGWHIGVGLLISFSYILFMQVSTTFATAGGMPAMAAVWTPNVIFVLLAGFIMRFAPK